MKWRRGVSLAGFYKLPLIGKFLIPETQKYSSTGNTVIEGEYGLAALSHEKITLAGISKTPLNEYSIDGVFTDGTSSSYFMIRTKEKITFMFIPDTVTGMFPHLAILEDEKGSKGILFSLHKSMFAEHMI